jgi:hypothetical protein
MGGRQLGARSKLVGAALTVGAVLGLTACGGGGGQSLAQQACVHVHRSVVDYRASIVPGTPATKAASLLEEADNQLRSALPLAAKANSADGTWNSLMSAIAEISTVDEGHLVASLDAQCAVADANPNVNPDAPGGSSGSSNSGGSGGGTSGGGPDANVNPASP